MKFTFRSSKVAQSYEYDVSFHNVGYFVNKNGSDVGGCTQVAIFKRLVANEKSENGELENSSYKLMSSIDYPYFQESNFTETDILDAIVEHAKAIFKKEIQWRPEISADSFKITLNEIWNILQVRQMCKRFEHLERIVSSDSGLKLFKRISDNRLECLFEIPSVAVKLLHHNDEKDLPPFEELCINKSDEGSFDGWGQPESDLLVKSGW